MTKLEPANGVDALRAVLTPREQTVFTLVCKGHSNEQIAHQSKLSEGTVKQPGDTRKDASTADASGQAVGFKQRTCLRNKRG